MWLHCARWQRKLSPDSCGMDSHNSSTGLLVTISLRHKHTAVAASGLGDKDTVYDTWYLEGMKHVKCWLHLRISNI